MQPSPAVIGSFSSSRVGLPGFGVFISSWTGVSIRQYQSPGSRTERMDLPCVDLREEVTGEPTSRGQRCDTGSRGFPNGSLEAHANAESSDYGSVVYFRACSDSSREDRRVCAGITNRNREIDLTTGAVSCNTHEREPPIARRRSRAFTLGEAQTHSSDEECR